MEILERHRLSRHQRSVGLGLAGLIVVAWGIVHLYGVFFFRWTAAEIVAAPLLIVLQCWLNVGLFIVSHDCMHGSLAPFQPKLNRAVGRLCLYLYAGFSFDRLIGKHFDHHRFSGTPRDPDFDENHPSEFLSWFITFFRQYFGLRELTILSGLFAVYVLVLGARPANALLFWSLPALMSAVQLFTFGTYLPHRHDEEPFGDRHKARSNDYAPWLSLLTCFHFGYHHEHHANPATPWWRLPRERSRQHRAYEGTIRSTTPAAHSAPPARDISSAK